MTIRTARLRLEPARLEHLSAFEQGGEMGLARALGAVIETDWAGPDALEAVARSSAFLISNPDARDWWMHFFFERETGRLIGLGGFKGAPSGGRLEIGYELAPSRRRQGLATEAAEGMVQHAFAQPEVDHVIAHTLAEDNTSTRVLKRVGFRFDEAVEEPGDGLIWRWRLDRA